MNWVPKLPILIVLALAVILVLAAVTREHYVPEFLEQGNVKRTAETADSSYAQQTNHVRPDGRFEAPQVQGTESPFRVNIWESYIP